jgi:cell division protein FtsB
MRMIQDDSQYQDEEETEESAPSEVPEVVAVEEPVAMEAEAVATPEMDIVPPPPSKFRRILRTILLWAIGLLGVFALGVGVTWFTLVNPVRADKQALMEELDAVRAEGEAQLSDLQSQHDLEIQSLRDEMVEDSLHMDLLTVMVDVSSARLALDLNNDVGARAALAGSDERLEKLQTGLQENGLEAVKELRAQLALALDSLESKPANADRAIEQLVEDLLKLERSLFSD